VSPDTTVLSTFGPRTPGGLDTRIGVFTTGLNQVYCNDNDPACNHDQSRIGSGFLLPGDYFVVVEGAGATSGEFTINMDTTVVDPSTNPALLPDIIVRQDDLYDNQIVTTVSPPKTIIRFSNGTANIGDGKLYVYGTGVDNGDGTEDIIQRIYFPNGEFVDRNVGRFVFHPSHNHIHVEEWCEYRCAVRCPTTASAPSSSRGRRPASASSTPTSTTPAPQLQSCRTVLVLQFDDTGAIGRVDRYLQQDVERAEYRYHQRAGGDLLAGVASGSQ
jgi:hypothetical protein